MKTLTKIYLNEMTLPWLERKLKQANESDFVAEMLKKEIESAKALQAEIELCEHEKGEFTGKKVSCAKCDSFYEEGCFESWTKKS